MASGTWWSRRGWSTKAAAAAIAFVMSIAAAATVAQAAGAQRDSGRQQARAPWRLAETGLYSDFISRTIDSRNVHYVPQYPLWSDGAAKQRWLYLPPGKAVDARDPERWIFPIGTKLWKEFAWGRPVETRLIERRQEGWHFASYRWTEDGGDAVLASEQGEVTAQEVAPGVPHRIPSVADCRNCHLNGRAPILGFSTLQLSPDRDPLAPHAEMLTPNALTLDQLVARGLVRGLPHGAREPPPRIPASTPRERAALGYLHANCGNCHDSVGPIANLGLTLRQPADARSVFDDPAIAAIGHASRYRPRGAPPGESCWIAPGDPSRSTILTRMASRNPIQQMPPLGTKVVDAEAMALLRSWIEQDLRPPGGEAR